MGYSGSSLGAALTPLLITPIAARWGWRAAFAVTAVLGLAWIALWLLLRVSGWYAASTETVASEREAISSDTTSRWSRNLFAAACAYGLGAAPLAFGLYAAPLYLTRVLHLSQASLGHLLWLPPAGWEAGYLFFGRLADRRRDRAGGREAPRPGWIFLLLSVAGFLITLAALAARSELPPVATMLLFFVQVFVAGGFVVFALSDGMAMLHKEHSAFLAGVCISAWALATGLLMPVLGHYFDRGQYGLTFWLVASLPPAGTLLWRGLSTPVEPSR